MTNPVDSVLFVCSNCQKLVIVFGDSEERSFDVVLKPDSFVEHFDITNLGVFTYLNLMKMQNEYPFGKFPICSNCLSMAVQQVSRLSCIIKESETNLVEVFQRIPYDVLLYTLKNTLSNCASYSPLSQSKQVSYTHRHLQVTEKQSPKAKSHSNLELVLDSRGSIITHRVFHISFFRHYSTINGCILGFYDSIPESLLNANQALFFLAQFVLTLLKTLVIPSPSVKLFEGIYVFFDKGNMYQLLIPEPAKTILIAPFQHALDILIFSILDIFVLVQEYHHFSLLYSLNHKERKIGALSYKFSWENRRTWSRAMKLLLINLKQVQLCLSKASIKCL